jgi:hypothetical protein
MNFYYNYMYAKLYNYYQNFSRDLRLNDEPTHLYLVEKGSTPRLSDSFLDLVVNNFLGIYPRSLQTGWV